MSIMDDYDHKKYRRSFVRGHARRRDINAEIRMRDGRDKCFACECRLPICVKHHIKPVGKDGESWIENLVQVCPNCHDLIHWIGKRGGSITHRRDVLMRYDLPKGQAFKIALLSTEEVVVDDGTIWPRTKLVPEDTLKHTELYSIFNWWPDQLKEDAA